MIRKVIVAAIGLLVSACASLPIVVPPPVQTLPPRSVQGTIRGAENEAPAGTVVTVSDDFGFSKACSLIGSRAVCELVGPQIYGVQGHFCVTAPDYEPACEQFVGGDESLNLDDVYLSLSYRPLTPLRVRGEYFELATGERFTVIGTSDFNLLARFMDGQDIRPYLQQRQDLGFNFLRVWTAFEVCATGCQQPIGRLIPAEHPDYADKIGDFLRLTARYRLYVEFTAIIGSSAFVSDSERTAHWGLLVALLQNQPGATLEVVNEGNHPDNKGWGTPGMYFRPGGVLASHGSNIQDSEPIQPYWDYATYRPGSGPEWMRKVAHNAMEDVADKARIPAVSNETTRLPDYDRNPDHAFDAAAGCALLSAGCMFHSPGGKNSYLFSGDEERMARAWVAGAKSVPLRCQGQFYRRIDQTDRYLRVYQRGTDDACVVRIRY